MEEMKKTLLYQREELLPKSPGKDEKKEPTILLVTSEKQRNLIIYSYKGCHVLFFKLVVLNVVFDGFWSIQFWDDLKMAGKNIVSTWQGTNHPTNFRAESVHSRLRAELEVEYAEEERLKRLTRQLEDDLLRLKAAGALATAFRM